MRNCPGRNPISPHSLMNVPSGANFRMRPVAPTGGSGLWPLWPSDTKMSPFGAVITSHGSLSWPGPLPGWPAMPSRISTSPSGLNLMT